MILYNNVAQYYFNIYNYCTIIFFLYLCVCPCIYLTSDKNGLVLLTQYIHT